MQGREKIYVVDLQPQEIEDLRKIANARGSDRWEAQRAQIVLTCWEHPDWSDQVVSKDVGCSKGQVSKWRVRWINTRSVKDLPRSGRPRVYSSGVRAQATALACSMPCDANKPLSRWSYADIAQTLAVLQMVAGIATSTIWRWLRAERIKPWRYHSWQHIIDENFQALAEPVLKLYEKASELFQQGVWVVCADEKTAMQALQGIHDPDPAAPRHPVRVAARYKRKGVINLLAGLSVAEGSVFGCCRENKCFVDFQAFILEHLVPEAIRRGMKEIRLILDNGPTHAPKQLETWLEKQQQSHQWPFKVKVVWLPKYASWLDQIEIWFSILQRKALTPTHFETRGKLIERILEFIEHYNNSAKPIKWSYTTEKLNNKLTTNL